MRRETDANIIPTNESLTAARKLESPEIDFFSKRMTYEEFQAKYPKLTTTKDEWDTEVARLAKERGVDGPAESVHLPDRSGSRESRGISEPSGTQLATAERQTDRRADQTCSPRTLTC
jgi:hypothetical protein